MSTTNRHPVPGLGGVTLLALGATLLLGGCGIEPRLPVSLPSNPAVPSGDQTPGPGDLDAGLGSGDEDPDGDPNGIFHLFDGGETDLDGDGLPDVVTYLDGGYLFSDPLHGYGVSMVSGPDGSFRMVTDTDGDGLPESETITYSNDSIYSQVESNLLDGVGTLERVTTLVHLDTLQVETTVEDGQRTDAGDVYEVVSVDQEPYAPEISGNNEQNTGCDGFNGFPDRKGTPVPGRPNIEIVADDGPGACPAAVAQDLMDFLKKGGKGEQTINDAWTKCLDNHNKKLGAKLTRALDSRKLRIGCSNLCPGQIAVTDWLGMKQTGKWLPRMNLNLSERDYPLDVDPWLATTAHRQVTVLHEILHWAGQHHSPDPGGNGRRDDVYSCSRFCGGCDIEQVPKGGYRSGASANAENCAACSDVPSRGRCGYRIVVAKSDCEPSNCVPDDVNHSFANGSNCTNFAAAYCDNTLMVGPSVTGACPGTCPSGTHSRCEGFDPQNQPDTCSQPLPECSQ